MKFTVYRLVIIRYTVTTEDNVMKPGDKIRAFRKAHKQSLRDFAERCGLSFAQVRLMEIGRNSSGKPSTPSWSSLQKAAVGMGITMSELLDGCDEMDIQLDKVKEHIVPKDRQEVIDKIILATPEQFSQIKVYVDFVMKA